MFTQVNYENFREIPLSKVFNTYLKKLKTVYNG